jgi:hypothetical protein
MRSPIVLTKYAAVSTTEWSPIAKTMRDGRRPDAQRLKAYSPKRRPTSASAAFVPARGYLLCSLASRPPAASRGLPRPPAAKCGRRSFANTSTASADRYDQCLHKARDDWSISSFDLVYPQPAHRRGLPSGEVGPVRSFNRSGTSRRGTTASMSTIRSRWLAAATNASSSSP